MVKADVMLTVSADVMLTSSGQGSMVTELTRRVDSQPNIRKIQLTRNQSLPWRVGPPNTAENENPRASLVSPARPQTATTGRREDTVWFSWARGGR
ncbi:hypothetical protein GQ457_01G020070 [Hibiscus cannabinus]